jgi:hypothetical protein
MVCSTASVARGEENKQIPLDSLLGKYEGKLEVHSGRTFERDFQVVVTSIDKSAKTVSLVDYCRDCEESKVWKRDNCKITDAKEIIKFTCKEKYSEEEYTFNGDKMKMTGHGPKYLYSANVKKVDK